MKANGQCSKGDNCSFRYDKSTQPNPSPFFSTRQNEGSASRNRSPTDRSPSGRMSHLLCKDYFTGTCTNSFCEKWHPPVCFFYKLESGCRFAEKCSYLHRQVEEQSSKRCKKNGGKSAVAMLNENEHHKRTRRSFLDAHSSNTGQLGCVFQDMEQPKSSSILRKSSHIRKPIRCAKFKNVVARHAYVRDQNPSLGLLQNLRIGLRRRRSDKSKVSAKQRGGWTKVFLKLKRDKAAFFSPSEKGVCLYQLPNLRNENLLSTPAGRCT